MHINLKRPRISGRFLSHTKKIIQARGRALLRSTNSATAAIADPAINDRSATHPHPYHDPLSPTTHRSGSERLSGHDHSTPATQLEMMRSDVAVLSGSRNGELVASKRRETQLACHARACRQGTGKTGL